VNRTVVSHEEKSGRLCLGAEAFDCLELAEGLTFLEASTPKFVPSPRSALAYNIRLKGLGRPLRRKFGPQEN